MNKPIKVYKTFALPPTIVELIKNLAFEQKLTQSDLLSRALLSFKIQLTDAVKENN